MSEGFQRVKEEYDCMIKFTSYSNLGKVSEKNIKLVSSQDMESIF